ncbi:hypothetical protein [Argonema antarcticum]|uniref:hypothetical protein n=1 Tax=Argonema antarcticum TaxID=2942763 RepID=UPI002011F27B|nr:hypothetical protein [Argonema antarcticum]MCL1474617.1 hypothetical protein [Argonema antarcticum A004/B2]
MNWQQIGKELVEGLEGIEDEETIRLACAEVVQKICSTYSNPPSRRNPLTDVRKEIQKCYPATGKQTAPYQYFTDSGKGKIKRWEHLALKHLTLSKQDWDELRGGSTQDERLLETEIPKQTKEFRIEDMNIKQLELDPETETMVKQALAQSEMNLADFIQKACQVYAKTITGKTRKHNEDLATVATEKLLNDVSYSTHPGRALELTKRAIRAIEIYNDEIAPANKDRWCITQTAIAELTGSRAATVKEVLADFKQLIDDHNAKYELNPYSNRKRGTSITEAIKLAFLVSDGIID